MYFLGYGLPLSVLYTFIFSIEWKLGVCVWHFGMMFLSINSILAKPEKWKNENEMNSFQSNKLSKRRPRKIPFEERLRVFGLAKYVTNYILYTFIEMTKYQPLRRIQKKKK